MLVKRIAACTHLSIFNGFPVIQPVSSKVRHFSTFFAHFGLPGYAPGTIAINVTELERAFNACKTTRCIIPIYLQPFLRYSDISVASDLFSIVPIVKSMSVFTTFCFPLGTPLANRGKCHTVGKRIQCCKTPRCIHCHCVIFFRCFRCF